MKAYLLFGIFLFLVQDISLSFISNFNCPMAFVDSSGNLAVLSDNYLYYSFDKEGVELSRKEVNSPLPCGKIIRNGEDVIIVGLSSGPGNKISYVSMTNSIVTDSAFDFASASIITLGQDIYVFGALSNSKTMTVLKRNNFQFVFLCDIEYNQVNVIDDTSCIENSGLVFCLVYSNLKVNYVFLQFDGTSFIKVSNYIESADLTDFNFGSFYHFSSNQVLLCCTGSDPKIGCRVITLDVSTYTITQSVFLATIPKPTKMLYFDAIAVNNEITLCSPTTINFQCVVLAYLPLSGQLRENNRVSINSGPNLDFRYGCFTRLPNSLTIAVTFQYTFSPTEKRTELIIFNEAVCATNNIFMGLNSVLTLPLTNPHRVNDFIVFRNFPIDPNEAVIHVNGNEPIVGRQYFVTSTFTMISASALLDITIEYNTGNKYPIFTFTAIRCDLVIPILQCYPVCTTCLQFGSDTDHQCLTCKTNYFPHEDHLTNCYDDTSKSPNWVLDVNQYKTCSSVCKSCNRIEEYFNGKYSTYCLDCTDNSFPLISLPECRNEQFKEDNIFFDNKSNVYVYCHHKCRTCSVIGNAISHNCIKCSSPTDYLFYETRNCIDKSEIPVNEHFTDEANKVVYPCLANCMICENNLECITCNPKAYFYSNQCYIACPPGTFIHRNECVAKCPLETFLISTECLLIFEPDNVSDDPEVRETKLKKDHFIDAISKDLLDYTENHFVTKGEDFVVQLVNKENQNESYDSAILLQLTRIYGDSCLTKLALNYSIPVEEIIIIKIDINRTDSFMSTNKVEFSFYDSQSNQLDRRICINDYIEVIFPIIDMSQINSTKAQELLDQGYDAFDPTDKFFNDLCTRFTNENEIDVTISKRREDYFQNVTFCSEGCDYDGVNLTHQTAKCKCMTILDLSSNEVSNMFVESISANFYVIYCYPLLLDFDNLKYCIGFWVMLSFILVDIILFINLISAGIKRLNLILLLPKYSPPNKTVQKSPSKEKRKNSEEMISINTKKPLTNQKSLFPACFSTNLYKLKHKSLALLPKKENNSKEIAQTHTSTAENVNTKSTLLQCNRNVSQSNQFIIQETSNKEEEEDEQTTKNNPEPKKKAKEKMEEAEVDEKEKQKASFCTLIQLNYKAALKANCNVFRDIYFFIETKHSIWTTFIMFDLVELRVLKIILFFNTIAIDFALNALLFSNSYVDMRYEDYKGFELLVSFPKSIFSFLIAGAMGFIFNSLTSSRKVIQQYLDNEYLKRQSRIHNVVDYPQNPINCSSNLKLNNLSKLKKISAINKGFQLQSNSQLDNASRVHSSSETLHYSTSIQKKKDIADQQRQRILLIVRVKLIIFFTLNIIVNLLFWYYVTSFCVVMQNSQLSWIYGCLKSLAFSILFQFLIALLLGFFKWVAIKCRTEFLFSIVEFISLCFDII